MGVGVQGGIEGSFHPLLGTISDLEGAGNVLGGFIGVGELASGELNSTNFFDNSKGLSEKLKSIGIALSPVTSVGVGAGVFFEGSLTKFLTKGKLELGKLVNKLIEVGVPEEEKEKQN